MTIEECSNMLEKHHESIIKIKRENESLQKTVDYLSKKVAALLDERDI